MLADLAGLKALLSVTNAAQDALLSALLTAADGAVKRYCKRDLETVACYQETREGSRAADLALYQRPVRIVLAAGNLTANSPVVTGLVARSPWTTGQLVAGMPVASQSSGLQLPANVTVLSVDSGTQVTLSANAPAAGAGVPLAFGLDAYMDAGAFYGQAPQGAYQQPARMILGVDFALRVDAPDGSSKSGLLVRLGGGPTAGAMAWPWGWEARRGTLSTRLPPAWTAWSGNLLVRYTAGLGVGAGAPPAGTMPGNTTIPPELTLAVQQLAAWMKRNAPRGGSEVLTSEGYEGYSYGLTALQQSPQLGSTRQVLSRFRERSV